MPVVAVAVPVQVHQLRPAMKAAGISQREVAKRLSVSHIDVCKALRYAAPGGLLSRIAETVLDADTASKVGQND